MPQLPPPDPRPSAGSARTALALAGLAAAALVALLWALRPTPPALTVDPLAGRSEAPEPLAPDLGPFSRGEEASAAAAAGARASAIELGGPGVRLRGPGRLVGRVLESGSRAGVSGARVELLALPPAGAAFFERALSLARLHPGIARRADPVAVAISGPGGDFAFEGVREGRYFLDALGSAHVSEGPARAEVLASGAGGPVELWVRPGGRVLGRMQRADGRPVSGASVLLLPGPGAVVSAASSGSLRAHEARTDSEGRFAFVGVAPGAGYEVSAQGPDSAVTHAIDIEVVAGEDSQVLLVAREGGEIRGRVLSLQRREAAGELPDLARPLAGAHLGAVPRGLRDLRFAAEVLAATHALSDAEGNFRMRNVPPGEVDLVAFAPGHLLGVEGPLRTFEGGSTADAEIELESGPSVRGRVVDEEGRALAGVRLRWDTFDLRRIGERGAEIRFAPFLTQAVEGFEYPVSGPDGAFVAGPFPGEPPHRIDFYAPGFQEARERWTPGEEPEELLVVMRRGGSIEGVVMDLATAEPVPRFRVESSDRIELTADEPGRFNPFSAGQPFEDPGGRFVLESVRAGEVSLVFHAPGYLPARVEGVAVSAGKRTRGLIVKMVPGGAARGVVVDALGAPLAGAQVFALPASEAGREGRGRGRRNRRGAPSELLRELPAGLYAHAVGLGLVADLVVRTDAQGAFELRGLEPGPTVLVALHAAHVPGRSAEFAVPEGESLEGLRIQLERGGGLFGTVEDRHGRPLAGSAVIAVAPGRMAPTGIADVGGGLYEGRADERGDYRIEPMSPGSYLVVATRGDEALDPLSFFANLDFDLVTVPAVELVRFDIVDEAAGGTRVYGRVSDGGGPIERGTLTAVGFQGEGLFGLDFKLARLREGGLFEFAGLAPGEYQFQLEGAGARARMSARIPDVPEFRLDLELPRGAIEGRVVEGASSLPVAGCEVLLRPLSRAEPRGLAASLLGAQGQLSRARSEADGSFRFERLEEGEYELAARPRAGEAGPLLGPSRTIVVELGRAERRRDLRIRLPEARSLAGVVRAEDGSPITGASVLARSEKAIEARAARARSDAEGRFVLQPLGPGEYTIEVGAAGYASTTLGGVELPEQRGAEREVAVVLKQGVLVTLAVEAADGRPVAGARGRLTRMAADAPLGLDIDGAFRALFEAEGGTDASGRIELGRFEPGEYQLTVWRGFQRTSLPVLLETPRSGAVELAVRMP